MDRKYFYARTTGFQQDVLRRITTTVVDAGLASQIPLVKLERNSRKEFYVFLGVDSDDKSRIPGGLGTIFQNLGIKFDEDHPLAPDQIKSMVQQQDIEIHGFNALQYRRRVHTDHGDPFEQSDGWQPPEASPEICARFERLLHWVSARGEGTWESFAQACRSLKVSEASQEARSALRRMILLGYLDLAEDGSRWSVAPAVLVRFPGEPEQCFLAGRRTNAVLSSLRQRWCLNETPQTIYPGPPRIDLCAGGPGNADDFTAFGLADAGATSSRLADLLPGLNAWKDSLPSILNLSVSAYRCERWEEGGFQTCDTVYDRDGVYYGDTGMYRLSRDGDRTGRTLTLFFDQSGQRWLRGDWYGLRFLALESGRGKVEAVHVLNSGELLIPSAQRWPLLFERALTLASGLLPVWAANPDWLSYPHIPLGLARTLCQKLNVNLREQ